MKKIGKKIVFFIVEGITDQISLENIVDTLVDEYNSSTTCGDNVIFDISDGDITSDYSSRLDNIKSKITKIIKAKGKRKFAPTDYKEVIHIIDTDGAYIDDSWIFQDETKEKFFYSPDGIYYKNRDDVIERNKHKRKIIDSLLGIKTVYGSVKYRVFFLSSNLEHVLHDEMNVEDAKKIDLAKAFESEYEDSTKDFISFMCNSSFACKENYKESWDFIKQDNNSIKRYTNLDIFINEYSVCDGK